jgi:hypothetical protein
MMRKTWLYVFLGAALCTAPVHADVWDVQGDNDNTFETDNELVHGTTQAHDLGALPGPLADDDWYRMPNKPYASYEIIIDGASGDLGFKGLEVARIGLDTTTVIQTSEPAVAGSGGYARALRWMNSTSSTVLDFVRISAGACGTACGADDVYTIRARETTVSLSRFNAVGSQATVLLTQNVSERPVNITYYFWSAAGALLRTVPLANHPPKALDVLNVATFPELVGQSGHVTVAHDGGYGVVNIKAVALEPSTGFSFDTPGVSVPY